MSMASPVHATPTPLATCRRNYLRFSSFHRASCYAYEMEMEARDFGIKHSETKAAQKKKEKIIKKKHKLVKQ